MKYITGGTIGYYIALFLFLIHLGGYIWLFGYSIYNFFTAGNVPYNPEGLNQLPSLLMLFFLPLYGGMTIPLWGFYLGKLYKRNDIISAISVVLGPVLWLIYLSAFFNMFILSYSITGKWEHVANYGFISSAIVIGIIYFIEMILNNRLAHKKTQKKTS